jgi:hypothetical protein
MADERLSTSEFQQIMARLDVILKRAEPPVIPLIDPTANVLSLVSAAITRQDDLRAVEIVQVKELRELTTSFQEKLDTYRRQTESDAKKAEADRIDALLAANKNDVALALAKQQSQAEAQDKRIAIVEQNQYQGAGRQGQQTENKAHSQWVIGLIATLALGFGALLVKVLFK